ncbi:MAG: hypothetical protein CM1200mP37_8630 [Chloroflexota bacterium]|nr:MAG: hypothetical protein CM1200mP37_8630 [Chloroflexota bacterium]
MQFKKTIPGKPAPLVIDKNKKFLYVGCRDSLQLTTLLRTEKSGELEILSSKTFHQIHVIFLLIRKIILFFQLTMVQEL